MIIMVWPENVNTNISLDGEFNNEEGYIETLRFDSGKERTWLRNSFVPRVLPALSLTLDNRTLLENEKTEFEEFMYWHNVNLRYGVMPFSFPRFGYIYKPLIEIGEKGVYQFVPESLNFDRFDGVVLVNFGLKEISVISEIEYVYLSTENDEILQTESGSYIVV